MKSVTKSILAAVTLTAFASSAFAGSYDFECKAYSLNKATNQLSEISLTRDEVSIDLAVAESVDPNIPLLAGEQTYGHSNESVKVKAKLESEIINVESDNMGPQNYHLRMYKAQLKVQRNGTKATFTGVCTETTIEN